ncbi:MAG: amino acid ABC transporter permease [Hyphomicrobiales bacterium]
MNYTFQFGVVFRQMPELLSGAIVTLEIALLSFWGGALLGLLLASLKTFGGPILKRVANAYVTFFTNTPVLIQIYFIFWGLPDLGIVLDAFTSVVIGLTLNTAAYLCEIMRAGFLSVRSTEMEAAETLGFSRWQQIRHVIVPHIAKTIYPAVANYAIVLTLGTSMAMIFGVEELTGRAYNLASENYRHLEMFTVVAGLYIVITFVMSLLLAFVGWRAFRVKPKIL